MYIGKSKLCLLINLFYVKQKHIKLIKDPALVRYIFCENLNDTSIMILYIFELH